jgi:threonine dehydratase
LFRLSKLNAEEKLCGIATCSAGNHGKAVAYAARSLGMRPTIYVPRNVDETKYNAMLALGAEVHRSCHIGYDDTECWALQEALEQGKTFISAFDDHHIMAGNGGSLAAETLVDLPEACNYLLPVGGGGLAAGFAYYMKEKNPKAGIICCQHELSPALKISLDKGYAVTRLPPVETVAGGIEGGIGQKPFEVLHKRVDRVVLLSEEEICQAVRWMLVAHQYLVEPSAAVTVAACLTGKVGPLSGATAIVLSGRNVDVSTVRRILE